MSKIEWTEKTWNPIAGCSIISQGCQNCYAMTMAHRLAGIEATKEKYGGLTHKTTSGKVIWNREVKFDEKALLEPLKRKKPTMYFVNSMSDLFYEKVPDKWIDKAFAIMALCPRHTFQVLSKRADRMRNYFEDERTHGRILSQIQEMDICQAEIKLLLNGLPLKNVWLGVSVENQKTANERIPYLVETPAQVRFLSCEPLLERISFLWLKDEFKKIHWVIVGGESGRNARPMDSYWVEQLFYDCQEHKIPFFLKQWGAWLPYRHLGYGVYCTPDTEVWKREEIIAKIGNNKKHIIPEKLGTIYQKLDSKKDYPAVIFGKEWKQMPCQPTS